MSPVEEVWRGPDYYEQVEALMKIQDGKCAICGVSFNGPGRVTACLDHDHETALTRGLLCQGCNLAEGRLDTPDFIEYRRNPPARPFRWRYQYQAGGWAVPAEVMTEADAEELDRAAAVTADGLLGDVVLAAHGVETAS